MRKYTTVDLDSQLRHARCMMARAGMPDLRLTRTCDDDTTMARKIEDCDPFQPWRHAKNPDTTRAACRNCEGRGVFYGVDPAMYSLPVPCHYCGGKGR